MITIKNEKGKRKGGQIQNTEGRERGAESQRSEQKHSAESVEYLDRA
jgi:hypothetical protein